MPTTSPRSHPSANAATEIVEFSPTEQLQQTLDVVTKNMGSRRLRLVGGNGSSSRAPSASLLMATAAS